LTVQLLAIGAHPDDIEIGAAALLTKALQHGIDTHFLILTDESDCRAARRAAEKVADDDAHNDGTALLYAARTFALCGDDGRAADLARQAADAADPPLDPPHEGIARRLIDRGRGQPPI